MLAWLVIRPHARRVLLSRRPYPGAWCLGGLVHIHRPSAESRKRSNQAPVVCSGSHEICALCVVALRDRFGGDDGAFHCPSCREPILPCFPINKNRGLMAALRLNERLARRRR